MNIWQLFFHNKLLCKLTKLLNVVSLGLSHWNLILIRKELCLEMSDALGSFTLRIIFILEEMIEPWMRTALGTELGRVDQILMPTFKLTKFLIGLGPHVKKKFLIGWVSEPDNTIETQGKGNQ